MLQPEMIDGLAVKSLDSNIPSLADQFFSTQNISTRNLIKPISNETSYFDSFKNKLSDAFKPKQSISYTTDESGKLVKTIQNDGLMSSDGMQALKGLYAGGLDMYNIYDTNRNYNLRKQQLEQQASIANKNYGLARAQYDNHIADKEAAIAGAKASGFKFAKDPKYAKIS